MRRPGFNSRTQVYAHLQSLYASPQSSAQLADRTSTSMRTVRANVPAALRLLHRHADKLDPVASIELLDDGAVLAAVWSTIESVLQVGARFWATGSAGTVSPAGPRERFRAPDCQGNLAFLAANVEHVASIVATARRLPCGIVARRRRASRRAVDGREGGRAHQVLDVRGRHRQQRLRRAVARRAHAALLLLQAHCKAQVIEKFVHI